MINVFHIHHTDMRGFCGWNDSAANQDVREPLALIAEYDGGDSSDVHRQLEEAFRYTNTVDQAWFLMNVEGLVPKVKGARSTSVGDLMLHVESDAVYRVMSIGMTEVTSPEVIEKIKGLRTAAST